MKWLARLKRRRPHKPASRIACPTCGNQMVFVEKFTMTGDDLRAYRCERCQKEHILNFGTALWKRISDANKSKE